jgi:hypothetical protein
VQELAQQAREDGFRPIPIECWLWQAARTGGFETTGYRWLETCPANPAASPAARGTPASRAFGERGMSQLLLNRG